MTATRWRPGDDNRLAGERQFILASWRGSISDSAQLVSASAMRDGVGRRMGFCLDHGRDSSEQERAIADAATTVGLTGGTRDLPVDAITNAGKWRP